MKRYVEARLNKERKQESFTNGIKTMLKEHQIFRGHGEAEHRVESMRRTREHNEMSREVLLEHGHVKSQQVATRKAVISKMEDDLAYELERRHAASVRAEQDRIRMYEGSEELRNLKSKLHAAKVNKERHQQIVEQLYRKEKSKADEEQIAQSMEYERRRAIELDITDKILKSQERGKVTAINQQQIIQREANRIESQLQADREKAQVDEIVRKIEAEDKRESDERKEKQEETRVMLRRFMKEQEQRQRQMELEEIAENRKIEEFAQKKREQEEAVEREKKRIEDEKRKAYESIVATAEARNKEEEELEYLRAELHSEELEAAQRRKEQLDARKKLQDRLEMLRACEDQKRIKEERKAKEQEEEAEFRKKLLNKFAEDDRIELLNEQKRRQKILIHKREVERLIQERRAVYEAERQKEISALAEQQVSQEARAIEIEAEKKRLLREHAAEFRDYLPKGMFETREDYEYVMGVGRN